MSDSANNAPPRKERAPSPSPSSSNSAVGSSNTTGESSGGAPQDSRRLYVFGLPETIKEAQLEELFSRHGKVSIMRIIYDHSTGKTKGYAFITMESESAGHEVIRVASQGSLQLDGRPLRVEFARGRSDRRDDARDTQRRNYSPPRRPSPRRVDDDRRRDYDDRRDRYDDRYRPRDDYRSAGSGGGSSYPPSSASSSASYASRPPYYPPAYPAPDPYYSRDRYAAAPPPSTYARDARDPYPPRDYRDPYSAAPSRSYPSSSAYGAPSAPAYPPAAPQPAYYDSRYDYARRPDDPRRDLRRDDRGVPPPVARPPPYPERYDDRRK